MCILYAIACATSCNNRTKEINKNISNMLDKHIELSLDSMSCYISANHVTSYNASFEFRYICYTDSFECSSCTLESLSSYKDFIRKYTNIFGDKLTFYFIFSPKHKDIRGIKQRVIRSDVEVPVFIDSLNIFERQNPYIPTNTIYHTFLIDGNDKIILVGNPFKNKKIENLMNDILSSDKDLYSNKDL